MWVREMNLGNDRQTRDERAGVAIASCGEARGDVLDE